MSDKDSSEINVEVPLSHFVVLGLTTSGMFLANYIWSSISGNWWVGIIVSLAIGAIVLGLGTEIERIYERRLAKKATAKALDGIRDESV